MEVLQIKGKTVTLNAIYRTLHVNHSALFAQIGSTVSENRALLRKREHSIQLSLGLRALNPQERASFLAGYSMPQLLGRYGGRESRLFWRRDTTSVSSWEG